MTRKSPRWLVEGIAWMAALVLFVGIAVVATGVLTKKTVTPDAETPVVKIAPATTPIPVITHKPVVVKPKVAPPKPRAQSNAVPVEESLGPPPGPQVDYAPTATALPADRYAFLVGVTHYRKPTHDTYAGAQDVIFIRSLLLSSGWLPQNIRMLTDTQATGDNMRAGLQWVASKSTPGTFTFFHFSGHVKQEGGHEKLWPYDRDFVTDTQLSSIMSTGTGKLWIDIAGCESGGFMENLPSSRVLFSSSSRVSQKSYEYPAWHESVYAGLLFDLGYAQGQADANKNGTTTIGEALRFAGYYAQSITLHQTPYGRQTPQMAGFTAGAHQILGWTLDNPPA